MKYQLSISILVSNHISTIRKCLESIKPLLTELQSELIIIDTGSTDSSIDVAREYTDKIIPFTWCDDFSAARNVALKSAQGEWFLYLDDDEWFEDVNEIIHFFQEEKYMEYGRAFYIQRNYSDLEGIDYSDAYVLRMFQITGNIHFKNSIHEQISPELNPLKLFNSYVHHYGSIGKSEEKKHKNTKLFLEKCKNEYTIALSTYDKITQIVDTALQQNNYDLLLSLLPYMETGDGYVTFQYLGEARHLLRILNIIALEEKYHSIPFAYQIKNKQELIEKYTLSLFSLRRIVFSLSSESIADAEYFLSQNRLSPFAIYILAKDELIIPSKLLFQKIQEIYTLQWNNNEIQLFQQLITTFMEPQ